MEPVNVLPLAAQTASLDQVGGKGVSLARMAIAGLPVPDGFHLTTAAYRRFVAETGLAAVIEAHAGEAAGDDADALARASAAIAARFAAAPLPDELAAALRRAYAALGGGAVAVRSSATAEDLPELSFAGQQETVLGVRGDAALLAAVRRCWASLWSARAIAYRRHMGVDAGAIAMAVVVQRLLPADVSGVLFTADPTTGARDRLLVNASFGLGEAVVAGEVAPDTYVLARETGETREVVLGAKTVMVVPDAQGTAVRAVPEARRGEPALAPDQRAALAALALRVEALFGHVPQDIEWALVDGQPWLLQARPITHLPPPPLGEVDWAPPIPGSAWIRRQVVEHMPEPVSPLFEDLYLGEALERGAAAMQAAMGVPRRIATGLIEPPPFATVHGFAYMRADMKLRLWMIPLVLLAIGVGVTKMLRNAGVRYWRDDGLPTYRAAIARWQALDVATAADTMLLEGVRELALADARYWYACTLAVGTAKSTEDILTRFLGLVARRKDLQGSAFLRGFPSRTLEAQAELEAIAARVRGSDALRRLFAATPPQRLLAALARDPEGRPVADAIAAYLARHGHQIYNLDFAAPTQLDEPLPVLVSLRDMSQGPGDDPHARLGALARARDALTEEVARALGPIRRRLFRRVLGMAQRFAPHREEALFHVGAAWPLLRRLALELGRRLADVGSLAAADDVFFLTRAELADASAAQARGEPRPELLRLARERRTLRAARKRLHPPAAVPVDFSFKLGPIDVSDRETQRRNADVGNTLRGFAVSPGQATAPACVIVSPAEFGGMRPGAVLVCATTTPAWTPLFARASALVTDIGGVLAHGSIVAREYGIPAVMGTGNGTRRISSGQRVTVDGDAGVVTLHEPPAADDSSEGAGR
ncbi:PEP/pyruvate-binding domain-containing protein [Nannocystis pusilla]|uniref:Phosphoenolpyruvate synthase n=1 Tax=Nannocystis pusilla TaxID=889268 RepID=A0ABS7TI54_9BACT|nr:PEP/pyruvate-binding domain-containing protein [Nannocystis pusilla]MBZ5707900.1 hypothetical protein [Nannocystis pusilla]